MIYLLSLAILMPWSTHDQSTASNPAAWIAVLREQERTHGRSAWTWQELCEARAAVLDTSYAYPASPTWLNDLYSLVLKSAPLIVFIITLAGIWLVWLGPFRRSWKSALCISAAWMLLLGSLLYAVHPPNSPAAIIKVHGIILRAGNGLSYPAITSGDMPLILAAGVEAEFLVQRNNGWVQIQLRDSTRGWVPLDAVYLVGVE